MSGAGATIKVRKRHYWNAEGNHAPYRNCLHDYDTDKQLSTYDLLRGLLAQVSDGQAVEITVTPLDDVDTSSHWRLVRAHEYRPILGDSPERRPAGVSPDACPSCVEDRVRDVESVGPDDDDYLDRPALGRTHPYGNGAV